MAAKTAKTFQPTSGNEQFRPEFETFEFVNAGGAFDGEFGKEFATPPQREFVPEVNEAGKTPEQFFGEEFFGDAATPNFPESSSEPAADSNNFSSFNNKGE